MTKLVATTQVRTWQAEEPSEDYDRGEPYSYRGRTAGEITNVEVFIEGDDREVSYYGDSHGKEMGDVRPGDRVYVVVADYETGDSFGHDGGQASVLDIFNTREEAAALADAAREVRDYGFEFNGVHYYTPWVGYFETLNEIEVWECAVKGHAPDPWYRIGH